MHAFSFENFEPNAFLAESASRKLNEILEWAPSDGFPVARLLSKKGGFEATIEIYSQAGYFVTRAFDRFPGFAVEEVCRQMAERLKLWRRTRDLVTPDPLAQMGFDRDLLEGGFKVS